MELTPELLTRLGIDPEDFARKTASCSSTKRFPTAFDFQVAHCAMRGPHTEHKCIFAGKYPMSWKDGEEGVTQ